MRSCGMKAKQSRVEVSHNSVPGRKLSRVFFPATMVSVSIVGLVPFVVIGMLQYRLGETEFIRLGIRTPTWLLMLPGVYWTVLWLFTFGHAVRHRARLRYLWWWIAAIAFLQIPAIICYWIRELVVTCTRAPVIDSPGK